MEGWTRLRKDLNRIQINGELGVRGNHPEVTFGGELVRELVTSNEYFIVTHEIAGKIVDIASASLMPYVRELVVDKERVFTPKRVITRGKELTVRFTDHLSLKISLCDLPSSKQKTQIKTKWNLNRPGGWKKYEKATHEIAGKIVDIVDNVGDIEEVIDKVGKLQEKSKFMAFNKTKIRQRKPITKDYDAIKAKDLLARQSEQIKRDILEIKSNAKGRAAQVFKMKTRLGGSNKAAQDAHAIKDPRTGELLVTTQEIKSATLEYNCHVLKNNVADEGFEELVKLKEDLHDKRMENKLGKGYFTVQNQDFNEVVKKFKEKGKQSYDFLVKAGEGFKHAVYRLCRRIIENEEFPACFEITTLQQIYKGKGSKSYLSNSRFIHLKDWLPRTCDALVVGGMKDKILENSSKFQIGGQA